MVSSNMPAFSANITGSTQSITTSTTTLIAFNTKAFDTASAFNNTGSTVGSAPAYSFNPQVAGYYQVSTGVSFSGSNYFTIGICAIYKNGAILQTAGQNFAGGTGAMNYANGVISTIVYLNGSTDYVQVYGYTNAASPFVQIGNNISSQPSTYFSASLIRTA
jgi:hypothetical protein